MAGTLDMQLMRYINLFSRISGVRTTNCFMYNHQIIFVVPPSKVSKAIGKSASNVKKINKILGKRIKIIPLPKNKELKELEKFISDVVSPFEFNKVEIKGDVVLISAGRQSKAALIGRGRIREKELAEVIKNYFGIPKLRIG